MPESILSSASALRGPPRPSRSTSSDRSNRVMVRDTGVIPQPPYDPLWRLRRGRILGPLWIFHSPKAHRIVRLRGDIVYYAWLLLEGDPEVAELCEQPFSIRIKMGDRWRSAIVDIWARMRDGRQLFIFVTYRNHLVSNPKSRGADQRMRALTAWAAQTGAALVLMPDTLIWRYPQLLSHWAHILRFLSASHRAVDFKLGDFVLRAMTSRRRMPLGEIESALSHTEPTAVRAAVFRLLHAGVLRADLREQRIGAQTVFTLP